MSRSAALVALHVAALLFGFAGLFGKWLVLPPVTIVLGRTLVAAFALALLLAARRDKRAPFDLRLACNGAILAIHWVTFFEAIQRATVAVGLLGFASFPLFVLVLERVVFRRRWTRRELATAVLVTVGLVLLVPELSWTNAATQGLAFGILSGATFALLAVVNRGWAARRSAIDVAFWQNAWAAVALAIVAAATGTLALPGVREIGLLLVLGLVCTALAHTLFIAALKTASTHTASVISSLEPVYGIVLALLLLSEVPTARTCAGGALIVAAAVLATRRG